MLLGERRQDLTVVLTGGVRTASDALVGPVAVTTLRSLHLDVVFMGVHGMTADAGFTTPSLLESETDQAFVESAQRVVVTADHTKWGVALCKMVGSERFKLLYDIYHMQIMEGDVIHTIRDNHRHIAHYHTAGVPGRHEIDESQELFYPAVMKAIADTGFTGYVAQEFVPVKKEQAMASLEDAYRRCAV